jgi:phospho-N-acetylmuramoyl-pentapeptide-transferase
MFIFLLHFLGLENQSTGALSWLFSLQGRALLAGLMSFVLMLILGRPFIAFLKEKQLGQMIRELGPASHYSKKNTPTMGGILIIFSILISSLFWGDLSNPLLWLGLFVLLTTGVIGGIDDGLKILKKNHGGLKAKPKFLMLSLVAILAGWAVWKLSPLGMIQVPFLSEEHAVFGVGAWIIVFYYFVLTGSANAVNLTDGQDGLVSFVVAVSAAVFVIFACVFALHSGNPMVSKHVFVPGAGEMAIFGASIIGAVLGFLWFNAYPAEVFMGDVGSLALGGALGLMAMSLKLELLYLLIGFVFVMEALSVILQVGYFKLTHGKRIFRMSPLHHHFELGGIPESKVTLRFWLVALICGLLALLAL